MSMNVRITVPVMRMLIAATHVVASLATVTLGTLEMDLLVQVRKTSLPFTETKVVGIKQKEGGIMQHFFSFQISMSVHQIWMGVRVDVSTRLDRLCATVLTLELDMD